MNYDDWVSEHGDEVETEWQRIHDEYGDGAPLLAMFKRQRYEEAEQEQKEKTMDTENNVGAAPSTLGAVVGFWIEGVPRRRKPTEEEIELHMKRCKGEADPDMPAEYHVMDQAVALMGGLLDQRGPGAHTHRQTLPIWPTRAQAQKAAKALDNEWWTHRVRMARKATA